MQVKFEKSPKQVAKQWWSAEIYMVWRTADLLKWSKQQNECSLYNYTNIQQFTQEKKGLCSPAASNLH